MKVFSDVIEKAQHLVTLIGRDVKVRPMTNSPIKNVLQLYNVSTQVDLSNSDIAKTDFKRNADQNTEMIMLQDRETNTVLVEENNSKIQPSPNTPVLSQNAEVQKLDEIDKSPSSKEKNLKKLSTHLLPPLQITRELVTQRIPNVIINSNDSAAETNVEDTNVGYEVIIHASGENRSVDTVRELREHASGINSKPIKLIDQQNLSDGNEVQHTDERVTVNLNQPEHTETLLKIANTNIYPTISNKIVQVLQDPKAQYMWKSYQVLENSEAHESCSLPEIDTGALSFIDDDIYKTYVNPNGKKNIDSKSNKSFGSTNISSNEKIKKSSNTNSTDLHTKKSSSSLFLPVDEGSKASINSILTRNRESLNEFNNFNRFSSNKHSYIIDKAQQSTPSKKHQLKSSSLNKNNTKHEVSQNHTKDTETSDSSDTVSRKSAIDMKIDKAVSANLKDYMAHSRARLSTERVLRELSSEGNQVNIEQRRSKLSKSSEKDLSDSTEEMILSINKVEIRQKSGIYGNGEKQLCSAPETSKKKYVRSKPLYKLRKSSYRNYDSSNERIVMRDIKLQTINTGLTEDSAQSKNSKESSSTHNTDESLKIVQLSDSVEEETVYCSYCTRLCFGKKRRLIQDDMYTVSSNKNSVQFLHNLESLKSQTHSGSNELKGRIRSIDELNELLEKKQHSNNDQQIKVQDQQTSTEIIDKVVPCEEIKEQKRKTSIDDHEKQYSDEVRPSESTENIDRKRSVKIEVPTTRQSVHVEKDSTIENFIIGLTNSNTHVPNPITPVSYSKQDVIGFIKQSSQEWNQCIDENKKKKTVMSVNLNQPILSIGDELKGGGGDKNSFQLKLKENTETSKIPSNSKGIELECIEKVNICKEILLSQTENSSNNNDDCQQSDGEILSKCDCSIGEIHMCVRHPENIFIQDLRRSRNKIINRKVQNLNWISYYVKPVRESKIRSSVPVNDSSDSFS
ncbi:hypothetical protein RN001_002790 [Aquatica leii]|uniref:Uncharacterized protein n=1 Tax=Aquatica leii TaxID=1421715 RepID=A0AAN7Q5N7_9COLE|nr:hypothetical protein RN001_002790 [Aquatica leii]